MKKLFFSLITLGAASMFLADKNLHAQSLGTRLRAYGAARPLVAPGLVPSSPTVDTLRRLPIERRTLENGLRVVLSPDRSVPTVAIAVYYDVGSRNEVRGRSGFAHLFEHMMFQGSANVSKGEHFALISARGGDMNGTTSEDRTNYYETLPSNELALGLWLEADRMRSLAITQENFENQRQTVMEERRQSYDNQPYTGSFLKINELAYGDYFPYAHSTIGDMADLQAAPLSAVQEFFATYYSPKNAVLSIAGDFEVDAALALIERYFGGITGPDVPVFDPGVLVPQTSERTASMTDALAPLPAFHMTWHIPQNRHADHYALELLSLILAEGESSRLYQKLVKGRALLSEISVSTDDRRGPDLFSLFAVLSEGHDSAEVKPLIERELRDIQRRGVSTRELQKAKNRAEAFFIFGIQSNLQRAQRFAEYELYYGNARIFANELINYYGVTHDDIKRVATQYLVDTNRTVLDVLSSPKNE